MTSGNSLFTLLPYELIEKIITADPRYILTVYYNILASCDNILASCEIDSKSKNINKNIDNSNTKKRKRSPQNPNTELANYLRSEHIITRLFKQSPWFRFYIRNNTIKPSIPRIYKSINTVFQYHNKYLAGYFKSGISELPINGHGGIFKMIENYCDYDKLDNAIGKIGQEAIDVLDPECITWLIILSSFISGKYSIPTARIYFNGLTDKLFSTHLYSYIDRDLIPLIMITFDMGYQFIISWDNVIHKLIGFIWGGSSGQEYEYYQIKLEKYLETRTIPRSCGKQQLEMEILKFLKKIGDNPGGNNPGDGNPGDSNPGDWDGLEESDFQLCSSRLSVL